MTDKTNERGNLPQKTTGDHVHTLMKAGLAAVPLIGGTVAELFNMVIAPPIEARKNAWLEGLDEAIKKLEKDVPGFKIEDLAKDEAFISATLQASAIALRTHREEKRTALRNALVNVIIDKSLDDETETFFLGLIDVFTVTHLELLGMFADPSKFAADRRLELGKHRQLTDPIVLDLNSRGLLQDPRPIAARQRESTEALVFQTWCLTPLGNQLLKFISS